MSSLSIAIASLLLFFLADRFYGRFLSRRVLPLDPDASTPAHRLQDGVDFVPTRPFVLFGHHFASIAGLGPLLGPAIAVIWGWVPALLWVVFGTIFIGAVHDFSCLVVSLRHDGRSVGEVARDLVGARARLLFLVLIFFILALAMGVFIQIIAILFSPEVAGHRYYPESVLPVFSLVLIAVAMGFLVFRRGLGIVPVTVVGIAIMFGSIVLGRLVPVTGVGQTGWSWILLAYAMAASVLPVWVLLQPRDYLNSFQLYLGMILIFAGLIVYHPGLQAPAFNHRPADLPPLLPFLFITVACGAISGFHSLVSSGTTARQLDREGHALPVGFGGMIAEGILAVGVVLACTAGLASPDAWHAHYASWSKAQGLGPKIDAFIQGSSLFISKLGIPSGISETFLVVVVVGFALTTLDSATRLLRYDVEAIGSSLGLRWLRNRYLSSGVAVAGIAYFALMKVDGRPVGLVLWQLFGTGNQLLAALGLLVASLFVWKRGRPVIYTLVPMIFMMAVTVVAMVLQLRGFWERKTWPLVYVGGAILILALWLIVEGVLAFRTGGRRSWLRGGVPGTES
jgi:carbon starvation protein